MRASRSVLTAFVLTAALLVPIAAHVGATAAAGPAPAASADESHWPEPPALVPGTATIADGTWSFTDYPYDDRGTGSFAYPSEGAYGGNAADPVVVQVRADAAGTQHLVRLDTLLEPASTIVAFAIDTDGDSTDPSTPPTPWPAALNAKVATPGWDLVIATWGTGASATTADGTTTAIPADVDVDANTLAVAVPRALADPGTSTWRYWGGAGVHDGNGAFAEVVPAGTIPPPPAGSPTGKSDPDQPNLFNLLFRNRVHDGGTAATDENTSSDFQFARQSAALSSGDIRAFVRAIDFGLLATPGAIVAPPAEPAGDLDFTRVYRSAAWPNLLPEGVSGSGATGDLFNGRYQPYRMFVPASYRDDPSPAPLLPMLHGWLGNHRGFNPPATDPPAGTPNFFRDVVRPHRVLVPKPLGRGQEIWYEHVGELDVLEVIADVRRHYTVDPERIFLGGTSMGGFGTTRISQAHPDLFAGIIPSVPPMSDRATGYVVPAGNDYDLVEHADNLRNVPTRVFTGTYDALVPAGNDTRRLCDRLKELVYDHDCWRDISSSGTHRGFENDRSAEIAALIANHRLVRDPARITYEINTAWVGLNTAAGVERLLPYDSAYWVSGITTDMTPIDVSGRYLDCRVAPDADTCFGKVDARTYGLGIGDPIATPIADDPSTTLIRDGLVLTPTTAVPRNAFDLTVANVTGLTLDLSRMGLKANPAKPLGGTLTGNGKATTLTLTLDGGIAGSCRALVDGLIAPTTASGGRLVVDVDLPGGGASRSLQVVCGR